MLDPGRFVSALCVGSVVPSSDNSKHLHLLLTLGLIKGLESSICKNLATYLVSGVDQLRRALDLAVVARTNCGDRTDVGGVITKNQVQLKGLEIL